MLALFERVVLTRDLPDEGLQAGMSESSSSTTQRPQRFRKLRA